MVYAIGSNLTGHSKTGLLKIEYGIEPEKLDASLEAVDDNIQKIKQGQFDDVLIDIYNATTYKKKYNNLMTQLVNNGSLIAQGDTFLSSTKYKS